MGSMGANALLSGAMYGAYGAMSYDSNATNPYAQTQKTLMGFGADQVVDIAAFQLAMPAVSAGYKAMGRGLGKATGLKQGPFSGLGSMMMGKGAPTSIPGAMWKGAGAGISGIGKASNFAMKNLGGFGIAAAVGLSFMGMDPGQLVMDAYDAAEGKYNRMLNNNPGFSMTHSTSRYMQDQLQTLSQSGNEAEIMHNAFDNYSDIPYDVVPTTKRSRFSVRKPKPCGFIV